MLYCFELPLAVFTLFGSVVKKRFGSCIKIIRFWIHDPKNPPLWWIIRINNPFLDFSKETKYPFSDEASEKKCTLSFKLFTEKSL